MTWLMLAKMPLLMSSRMMSAGLTPSSSASSLTMIDEGISMLPRAAGSTVCTELSCVPSGRRGGFLGPRVLRVPLRLRAMLTSVERHEVAVLEPLQQLGGDWCGKGPLEGRSLGGRLPAGRVGAEVGTPARQPSGHVHDHVTGRGADDTHQITLRAFRSARDTGPDRDAPRRGGGGAYDATSVVTGSSADPAVDCGAASTA